MDSNPYPAACQAVQRHADCWMDFHEQLEMDRRVAGFLGISWTHAALVRVSASCSPFISPSQVLTDLCHYTGDAGQVILNFWWALDAIPAEHVARIGYQATLRKASLSRYWRRTCKSVRNDYPGISDVLFKAAKSALHTCPPRLMTHLNLAKARATCELLANQPARLTWHCPYVQLFGFSNDHDTLDPGQPDSSSQPAISGRNEA
ncbi:MAG TPA: hypothetical protein VIG90_17235 [Pedomonas sp.]